VVEDLKGPVCVNHELECISCVEDGDGERVVGRAPEQGHVDSVVRAVCHAILLADIMRSLVGIVWMPAAFRFAVEPSFRLAGVLGCAWVHSSDGAGRTSPDRLSPKRRSSELWNFPGAGRTLAETLPFIRARCARTSSEAVAPERSVYTSTATAREEEEQDVASSEPSPQRIGAPWQTVLSPFRRCGPQQAPKPSFLAAIGLAGIAAAAATAALGLTNDELSGVGTRAFLNDWLTINFILAGLVAWWRRPDSRFGPLVVAAGFANFLSTLSWATADLPFTIGFALGLLPPLLFLHVFLAYPSGRSDSSNGASSQQRT
jgi:hypothetical protein